MPADKTSFSSFVNFLKCPYVRESSSQDIFPSAMVDHIRMSLHIQAFTEWHEVLKEPLLKIVYSNTNFMWDIVQTSGRNLRLI